MTGYVAKCRVKLDIVGVLEVGRDVAKVYAVASSEVSHASTLAGVGEEVLYELGFVECSLLTATLFHGEVWGIPHVGGGCPFRELLEGVLASFDLLQAPVEIDALGAWLEGKLVDIIVLVLPYVFAVSQCICCLSWLICALSWSRVANLRSPRMRRTNSMVSDVP